MAAQKWSLTPLGGGQYRIVNVNSGKALGIQGSSTANSAPADQYEYLGVAAQKWTLTSVS